MLNHAAVSAATKRSSETDAPDIVLAGYFDAAASACSQVDREDTTSSSSGFQQNASNGFDPVILICALL
jgi:hypothetical protein